MPRWTLVLAIALASACTQVRYLGQASFGQLELLTASRPIDEVLADPETDARTRVLLREVEGILAFARAHGLDTKGNYRRYVPLDREAVVWMVTASRPLAFEPKTWWFPIVGSFPYLGWFDWKEGRRHVRSLERDDWDVMMRPVRAYSTGGWFDDPVLSTMLSDDEDAFRYLTNVLLHELVHANILVPSQSTYNESLASFVGDAMAEDYLRTRFGADSAELAAYREQLGLDRAYGARLHEAYRELEALYESDQPDANKRARKRRLLEAVRDELGLFEVPNNANLIGFATYNAGLEEFAHLFEVCGRDWPRFLAVAGAVDEEAFAEDQLEEIDPVIRTLADAGCVPPAS